MSTSPIAREPAAEAERARLERRFGYLGHEIEVRGDARLVGWLTEVLTPWFEIGPSAAPPTTATLTLEVDADRFRAWLASARSTGRDAEWIRLDQAAARWPVLVGDDGRERALDAEHRFAVHAVGHDGPGPARHVQVLAEHQRPGARLAALRLVRELASAAAIASGALPLHAAVVADRGALTLVVGPKRAGKSSILVHAIAHHGARFVANDRAFVTLREDGAPRVRGMPSIVGVRDGTAALAEGLASELASGAWHYAASVAEARAWRAEGRAAPHLGAARPPGLSPAQLCSILATEPLAGGALASIVFPEIVRAAAAAASFEIRPLAPDEAARRLLASGLLADARSAAELGHAPLDRSVVEARVRALAERVPSVACRMGARAYTSPSVWEALREQRD